MFFVYILKCSDGNYYTGCTNNLEERLHRHTKGYIDSTKNRLPLELIYYSAFPNQNTAFAFEKYLKSGSGIAFRNKHLLLR
jgi:predicted GIY-YIG superfamily endonuclease